MKKKGGGDTTIIFQSENRRINKIELKSPEISQRGKKMGGLECSVSLSVMYVETTPSPPSSVCFGLA